MNEKSNYSAPLQNWKTKDTQSADAVLLEFNKKFPSDKQCIEEIIKCLNADWCKSCASREVERKFGARRLRCCVCKKYSWPLAGTFFDRMKHPKLYLFSILFHSQGFTSSSKTLAEWFGTAYATAYELMKKLRIVAMSSMSATSAVPVGAFRKVLLRRCLETPAEKHPSTEPDNLEEDVGMQDLSSQEEEEEEEEEEEVTTQPSVKAAGQEREECINNNGAETAVLTNLEDVVSNLLSSTPISFDELVAKTGFKSSAVNVSLTMLEFAGRAMRVPGDRYIRKDPVKPAPRANGENSLGSTSVAAIKAFINHYYGGISRRYAQLYVASFWMNSLHIQTGNIRLFELIADFGIVARGFLHGIRSNLSVLIP